MSSVCLSLVFVGVQDGEKLLLCGFGLGSTPQNSVTANPFATGNIVGGTNQTSGSAPALNEALFFKKSALGSIY